MSLTAARNGLAAGGHGHHMTGIDGFAYRELDVGDARYRAGTAGGGPPVLLLHGFPQTHYCWHAIAPALAEHHSVVVTDLRGYGDTVAPPGGPHGEGYGKREMAAELVDLMEQLGFERFAVAGTTVEAASRIAWRSTIQRGSSGWPC
jgi:pimeloyl-ACP methyl ester carboxylesterase